MKGIVLTIVGMALLISGSATAERGRPRQVPGPQRGGHVPGGPAASPSLPPTRPAAPAPESINPAAETDLPPLLSKEEAKKQADQTEAEAQKVVDDFIKQAQADQKALDEQKAALEKAVAENERATNAVNPEEAWALFQTKLTAILARLQALQAQVKDKTLPENILIKEIAATQLKEFTEGKWAVTAKAIAGLSPADRATYLKQYKGWVLKAVSKVEMAEKAVLWSEKYIAKYDKLTEYERVAILQPDKWKEVLRETLNETRAALRTPGETSLYHPKNKDMLWAQPPMNELVTAKQEPDAEIRKVMNQEIKLEMVDQFLYHQKVIQGMPDADIAANDPNLDKKEYDAHRERLAQSHLFRNAMAHTGRVVEAIPGAGMPK